MSTAREPSLNKLSWSLFKLGCWALFEPPTLSTEAGSGGPAGTQLILNLGSHGKRKKTPKFYWQNCHSRTPHPDYGKRLRGERAHNPFFGYLALILSEVMDYIRGEQRPHTSLSCVSAGHPGQGVSPSPPVVPTPSQGDGAWPLFQ